MKHALIILVLLACNALAQNAAVTKNSNTEVINGDIRVAAPNYLMTSGPLMAHTQSLKMFGDVNPLSWQGYNAHFSVFTNESQHGLISKSSESGGVAIIGTSDNGSSAGKFVQTEGISELAKAALFVGRYNFPYYGTDIPTPALTVEGGTDGTTNNDRGSKIAVFQGDSSARLTIFNDGFISAPGVRDAYQHHQDSTAVMNYQWGLDEFKNIIIPGTHASAVPLANGVMTNISGGGAGNVDVIIPPGIWEVWATVLVATSVPTAISMTEFGISINNNSLDAVDSSAHPFPWTGNSLKTDTVRRIFEVGQGDTLRVYLNVRVSFSSGNVAAGGTIRAVRLSGPSS